MNATVYVDASFGRDPVAGGWGAWCRSDLGRIIRSGPCPDYVETSVGAEVSAIYAGVYLAVSQWPSTRFVLVMSDCRAAMNHIKNKNSSVPAARELHSKLYGVLGQRRILMKWVKGHTEASTGPGYLNERVDDMARDERVKLQRRLRCGI